MRETNDQRAQRPGAGRWAAHSLATSAGDFSKGSGEILRAGAQTLQ